MESSCYLDNSKLVNAAVQYDPELVDLSEWMTYLPPILSSQSLFNLAIPGTHDSGATPSLSTFWPVANDFNGVVPALGKMLCVRKGIRRWAVTQSDEIMTQLINGVRYLDFRVSLPPISAKTIPQDFYLVHALYGGTLRDSLEQIRAFLDIHPKEVVIIDLNHVHGAITNTVADNILKMIGEVIGWNRLCPPVEEPSLDMLWAHRFQVIVPMCVGSVCRMPFWPMCMIESQWPKLNKVLPLMAYLEKQVSHVRSRKKFFVLQAVLTAEKEDVLSSWWATLRDQLSIPARNATQKFLAGLPTHLAHNVNIVITDFVEDSFSRTVIGLNFSRDLEKTDTLCETQLSTTAKEPIGVEA